jgi:hypothetical protein
MEPSRRKIRANADQDIETEERICEAQSAVVPIRHGREMFAAIGSAAARPDCMR